MYLGGLFTREIANTAICSESDRFHHRLRMGRLTICRYLLLIYYIDKCKLKFISKDQQSLKILILPLDGCLLASGAVSLQEFLLF